MPCLAAGMSHVRHVQGRQDRSCCPQECPRSPGVLGSADTRAAEGHVRGHGSFTTRGEDPAVGIIFPAPPAGHSASTAGAQEFCPGPGQRVALLFLPGLLWDPQESWGWLPGSAEPAEGDVCASAQCSAGSFTRPAERASWTRLSPSISCWDGWAETSSTSSVPSWLISCPCRYRGRAGSQTPSSREKGGAGSRFIQRWELQPQNARDGCSLSAPQKCSPPHPGLAPFFTRMFSILSQGCSLLPPWGCSLFPLLVFSLLSQRCSLLHPPELLLSLHLGLFPSPPQDTPLSPRGTGRAGSIPVGPSQPTQVPVAVAPACPLPTGVHGHLLRAGRPGHALPLLLLPGEERGQSL